MLPVEDQYLDILRRVYEEGATIYNERTGKTTKVLLNETIKMDVSDHKLPILTTKKVNWKMAIGEILCYLRGYENLEQFHKLGVKTWDANANAESWKSSPHCKWEGDVGKIYGALGNSVPKLFPEENEYGGTYLHFGQNILVLENIIDKLRNKIDDRGLIWNFWYPGMFHLGCLRPCVFMHQFSLVNGKLHLTSYARSQDLPLGTPFNLIQCAFLLITMAKITGNQVGTVTYHMANCHIYEDQLPLIETQLNRTPIRESDTTLIFHKKLTKENLLEKCRNEEDNFTLEDISVEDYRHHPFIKYPFSV